ncbi:hypothetical protein AX17_004889 [Amanita inopinata Kibby_2008]|nr:hypothetical protein AX17_004889 [Amanita inopinata Kibby_2008]
MAVATPVPVSLMQQSSDMSYAPSRSQPSTSEEEGYYFALAEIKGDVQLVQISLSTPPSALSLVDIKIFKHELATIFRHAETTTLHPADVRVVEEIHEHWLRYEEDSGTVFLAKEIVDRMRRLSAPPVYVLMTRNAAMERERRMGSRSSQYRSSTLGKAEQARMLQARYGGSWQDQR